MSDASITHQQTLDLVHFLPEDLRDAAHVACVDTDAETWARWLMARDSKTTLEAAALVSIDLVHALESL